MALLPVVGPRSVLLLEGSEHLARRKLMLPPFHGERMRAYEATVRDVVARDVAGWPRGEAFAVHPRMQAVTLEVIVRAVFGVTDPARGERLRALLRGLLDATASFGLQFGFMLARRIGAPDPLEKLRRQRAEIDELLLAEIGERRAEGGGEDILSLLLQARFEDGAPMADQEVCDQLVTLLVAGHETTATALAWTLELLVHHPAALERLGDGSDGAYLKAVINESLRLRPVVPLAGRRLSSELQVDGHDAAGGHRRDARDLARPHARGRLSRAVRVPARALARRRGAARLRVGAVRRRGAALPRRGVRGDGDAGGAGDDAVGRARRGGGRRARARGAPQRHLLAGARDAARSLGGVTGYLVLFVADEADDGHADALRETARGLKGAGFFDDPDLGGQRTTGTYLETDTLEDPVALELIARVAELSARSPAGSRSSTARSSSGTWSTGGRTSSSRPSLGFGGA